MDFEKYFNAAESDDLPEQGIVGVETEWLKFGELDVPIGGLWLGDARVTNRSEGVIVRIPPRRYTVQLKGMDFNGARVPSRARVIPTAKTDVKPGAKVGEAITDSAMIGICDIDALDAAVTAQHVEEYDREVLEGTSPPCTTISTFMYGDRQFDIAWVVSGIGDGAFDVYALQKSGKAIGVEIEFLPPGYKME